MAMNLGTIGSVEAIEMIEKVRAKQSLRAAFDLWDYGYQWGELRQHRWFKGVLNARWLATLEEARKIRVELETFRREIEGLNIVHRVEVESLERKSVRRGEALIGEKWRIHFKPEIVYTHYRQ